MYRSVSSSGLGSTPLSTRWFFAGLKRTKEAAEKSKMSKPVFVPPVLNRLVSIIGKPSVIPMAPVVNITAPDVFSARRLIKSDSVAAAALGTKLSTTEIVAAAGPLISTPVPGSPASVISKPLISTPAPGSPASFVAMNRAQADTWLETPAGHDAFMRNALPFSTSGLTINQQLALPFFQAWNAKIMRERGVVGPKISLPAPLATESAPAAATTPPVALSAGQEADVKKLLATFPDVLDQAITDYAKLKAGLSYSMKNQTQLFTADQLNTVTAWFVRFPDLWDTLAPNYDGSTGDPTADQYRASVKAKAEAFVKKLRGDTVLYPGLGVLPFIVIAGVIIAGLLGVGAAIWAIGYVQQQRNISAIIDGVVAGNIPADVLDQAITEAQTSTVGQIGDVLKYAVIAGALVLLWPMVSNFFGKIGKKA